MTKPKRHRIGTLLALAILLASMTMGNLTVCDVVMGEPEAGRDYVISLKAGETALGITGPLLAPDFYRFSLCGPIPDGVYYRIVHEYGLLVDGVPTSVDIITSPGTPPGHYSIDYVEGGLSQLPGSNQLLVGKIDLTILPPDAALVACFHLSSEGPITINHAVFFIGCSSAPPGQTIVLYKWWFDYDGNPSSDPSLLGPDPNVQHTYTTAGSRTVRLVVVTDDGDEAATAQSVNVVAP